MHRKGRKKEEEVFSDSTSSLALLYIPTTVAIFFTSIGSCMSLPNRDRGQAYKLENMPNRGSPSHLQTSAFIFNSRNEQKDNSTLAVAKTYLVY